MIKGIVSSGDNKEQSCVQSTDSDVYTFIVFQIVSLIMYNINRLCLTRQNREGGREH